MRAFDQDDVVMNTVSLTRSAGLADTSSPGSLSSQFRRKRDVALRNLIGEISAAGGGRISILDLGGSVEYWRRVGFDFLRDSGAKIVVLNVEATELKTDGADPDLFEAVVGDACDLPHIADNAFDLAHSNSVIEHVGNWSRMKRFGAEVRRVGRDYYVQTPYFWSPVEPHFYRAPMIHWLPRPIQARIMATFPVTQSGKASSLDDAFRILDGTQLIDRRQMQIVFPDAAITRERVFGLTKSLIATRRG
jgi:hypothetical protein